VGASSGERKPQHVWLRLRHDRHHAGAVGSRRIPPHAKAENRSAVVGAVDVWQFHLRGLVSLSIEYQRQRYAGTWAVAFNVSLDGHRARGHRTRRGGGWVQDVSRKLSTLRVLTLSPAKVGFDYLRVRDPRAYPRATEYAPPLRRWLTRDIAEARTAERAKLAANVLDSPPGVLSNEDEGVAEALTAICSQTICRANWRSVGAN